MVGHASESQTPVHKARTPSSFTLWRPVDVGLCVTSCSSCAPDCEAKTLWVASKVILDLSESDSHHCQLNVFQTLGKADVRRSLHTLRRLHITRNHILTLSLTGVLRNNGTGSPS